MSKTQTETVALAFKHLGINATGETASADESNYATDVLDGVVGELATVHGITVTFPIDDDLYLPLSHLLAVEISPHYELPPPVSRANAVARIRAVEITNDAEDRRDTNNDTIISEAEENAGDRALFY